MLFRAHFFRLTAFAMLAGSTLLAGCSRPADPQAESGAADQPAYAAVARGRVDVEGGLIRVGAAVDGTIAQVAVRDGDKVRKGQPLIDLDPAAARLAVDAAQAELRQLQAQERVQRGRIAGLKQQAQRLAEAAAGGAVTGQSADDARHAAVQAEAEAAAALAAVEVARQKVLAAQWTLERQQIRAPADGEIVGLKVQLGNTVTTQTELLQLLPRRPLLVRADVNEAYVAALKPGMQAEIVSEASPEAPPTAARLERIGSVYQAMPPGDDPQDRVSRRGVESLLSIAHPEKLRVGQRVLVRFLP
ncbi:p-hydroxybenzoic acid efflux pump subunit AaeA [Pigmentiphaga humi]|uniref:p-hydroxybenzoic acid efflux pump subunit AaeA n=1 Tax=Pigmentiphaga humi TaxID=2478468 RepID=A0A3P4B2B9_9BURK|nr:efflux RND transporter periplasmic adaptor subunit [Pigmentiphaga humi]VCU69305.1 p-hydroxybenzoic acid efflux pump subunit AaeA [Pigmentiphaga humi]